MYTIDSVLLQQALFYEQIYTIVLNTLHYYYPCVMDEKAKEREI